MKLVVLSALTLMVSSSAFASGDCSAYNRTTKVSTVTITGGGPDFVEQLAKQHLVCAVAASSSLRAKRQTIVTAAVENAGGYSGSVEQPKLLIKSSWVSDRGGGGDYTVEATEAVTTDGVGTGLFGGTIDRIKTEIEVSISGSDGPDDESPIVATIKIKSTTSDGI